LNKVTTFAAVLLTLFLSCTSKNKSLSDRVRENFTSHVKRIDSTLVVDSFSVIRVDTINRRMERLIDKYFYTREFNTVKAQLANAMNGKRSDSIAFYQEEVNYMQTQFDSLNNEILKADTTKKLGLMATCKIQLAKNNRSEEIVVYYFLDWNMKVWNPEMIDTVISGLSRRLPKN
jgi:hypothetical protein